MKKLTVEKVATLALALGGVTVKDHFGSDAYAANGRNVMTVCLSKNTTGKISNDGPSDRH